MKKFVYIYIYLIFNILTLSAQKDFTVVIDAGHGGKDPGARGATVKEKAINLAVALKLGGLIEQNNKDVKVVYTRKTDVFVALDERANIANRNEADLFISIHVNSVKKDKKPYGAETYTLGLANSDENLEVAMTENSVILLEDDYPKKYKGFDPNSAESYIMLEMAQGKQMEYSISLASEIQQSFQKNKRRNRGVRQAGFLVLKRTTMPGVLIELGFITNPAEERFLASKNGQTVYAQSIYDAFKRFKKDYDRKNGAIKDSKPVDGGTLKTSSTAVEKPKTDNKQNVESDDGVTYKIQILTSDRKLSPQGKQFKGYGEISYYEENGIYKYTYGEETDYQEIIKKWKKASKDFKGAFIIRIKDGKRLKN
ncbi:MAG: N-acetylmuramoyl-L-alanine amidase [Tannerella sp.]|jgi:N-acetylmuramoyl-L-alanine amidase|nr:N-acetylmuramoyl-L-alanine amidase [Tannerella sp.]